MAKDLNKKPNEAFIEAIRKFDSPIKFEELFAGKYLSEDDLYRNGEIVQMNNEMNNKIQTFFNDTIGEMYKALEEIIGYYITNDMIKNIEEFRKIQDKKNELENEIARLKREILILPDRNSAAGKIKSMHLELMVDEKSLELEEVKKAYLQAYREGLVKTVVSEEYNSVYFEIEKVKKSLEESMDREIALYRAKTEALNHLRANIYYMLDDYKGMIDQRLGASGQAELILTSSRNKYPIIQAQVK